MADQATENTVHVQPPATVIVETVEVGVDGRPVDPGKDSAIHAIRRIEDLMFSIRNYLLGILVVCGVSLTLSVLYLVYSLTVASAHH